MTVANITLKSKRPPHTTNFSKNLNIPDIKPVLTLYNSGGQLSQSSLNRVKSKF